MVLISVLPVGLLQTVASVEHGRLRVVGDTIFAAGVLVLG
jgi:hypothetical protein